MRRPVTTSATRVVFAVMWVALVFGARALAQAPPDEAAPAEAPATGGDTPAVGAGDAAGTGDATDTPGPATGVATDTTASPSEPASRTAATTDPGASDQPDETPAGAGADTSDTSLTVYEYSETITVTDGGAQSIELVSSQIVVVRRTGDIVDVELKPKDEVGRDPADADSNPRGKIELRNGGASPQEGWDLEPATARFDFSRTGEREPVRVTGLRPAPVREFTTIIGQARDTNVFGGEGTSTYKLEVVVAGRPYTLTARQTNSEMWVDWVLSQDGVMRVGSEQVLLPVDFSIESANPPKTRMTLTANAHMDYSTALLGPDSPATIVTTLKFARKGGGTLTYKRDSSLRMLRVADNTFPKKAAERPDARKVLAGSGFAGDAGAWSRSITLALFGAQGLVGMRDAGLAMWLAQSSVDTVAGRTVRGALADDVRPSVVDVSKLSPPISAPPKLLSDDVAGRSRYRVAAGFGQHTLADMNVGALAFGQSDATSIYGGIAMMKKSGSSFYGWGGKGVVVQSMESAERYWYAAGVLGKVEFGSEKFRVNLAAGPGVIYYLFQSPSGVVGADVFGFLAEADVELKLGSKLGLFVGLDTSNDLDAVSTSCTTMGLRVYARESLAIQVATSNVYLSDEAGSIGLVEQEDLGDGSFSVGVMARW